MCEKERYPLLWRLIGTARILERLHQIMDELKALTDAVTAEKTVEDSAVTLLTELTAKINTLVQNATDLAALKAGITDLTTTVNANKDALASAVTANTPSA